MSNDNRAVTDDNRVVTVFMFDLSSMADIPGLIEAVAYHTRTGKWPTVPPDEPQPPAPPRFINFNGQVNLRSAPIAQSNTLIAPTQPSDARIEIIGAEENGYTPVRVWVFTPRVKQLDGEQTKKDE